MNRDQLRQLESDLWSAADNLRANSDLRASEYATPLLGLVFLRFADNTYRKHEPEILAEHARSLGTPRERPLAAVAVERCGFYLPPHARYDHLLSLPPDHDIARALHEAMAAVEAHKPELAGALPKDAYSRLTRDERTRSIPAQLLKTFAGIPADLGGDLFGQIYEYFLAAFARSEGSRGGEFFTPRSVVRLMVEILEPHGGTLFDPACGSGGMFVQSARFVADRRRDLHVHGQEKTPETVNLARMNLAVNGLRGAVVQANAYYDDPFASLGAFDYVLANPPFNVDDVRRDRVANDPRFNTYGVPRSKTRQRRAAAGEETIPNGNYLWINLVVTSLKPTGRAALIMANSASDARHSEAEIRRALVEQNLVATMVSLPSNMFYTVTLPATLWFFDRAKPDDRVLFIHARNIFTRVDRAHRELSDPQIESIAVIAQLRHGRRDRFVQLIDRWFAAGMQRLGECQARAELVSTQLLTILDDDAGRSAAHELTRSWATLDDLRHHEMPGDEATVDDKNRAQHQRRASFDPLFTALHAILERLDSAVRVHEDRPTADRRIRPLRTALQALHAEVLRAESTIKNIGWLQDRFPAAAYEDVTGLCKLATRAEVEAQEYSLNPGRHVGVAIEEDGKTEDEFLAELASLGDQLAALNSEASALEAIVQSNLNALIRGSSS